MSPSVTSDRNSILIHEILRHIRISFVIHKGFVWFGTKIVFPVKI